MGSNISIIFLVVLCSSCAPEGLMRTWSSNQEYDHQFKNVLAMGLVNDISLRSNVEDEVVYAARQQGIDATNGLSMFPPELGKPLEDVERFKSRLREKGFDAILTVAIIDIKAERYVKQTVSYEPMVFYDRFRSYYYQTYGAVYKKGYFSEYSRYFIETNFYELKGGTLVWSGRSEVFEPSEIESVAPKYGKRLFKELISQGIISK